jgi:hypothetical protein
MKIIFVKIISIILSVVITTFTLSHYSILIQHLLSIKYNWQFELFMVLGMVFFQYLFIYSKNWSKKLDYFFKLLLVSLLGSVLLWPLILVNTNTHFSDAINIGYFFCVVTIMFFVHKNIVTKMQLPFYLSYTYILYRFIILLFIIKL